MKLAKFYYSHQVGDRLPVQRVWSRHILWGNHMITGGYINPKANAWTNSTVWGYAKTLDDTGDNIVWGTMSGDDNIVWGTADENGDNIVWGTCRRRQHRLGHDVRRRQHRVGHMDGDDNIVWGTDCGGADCDNIVWGTSDDDNIVWGTASPDDNIVWGTAVATTTSCGARPTTTTSCGAPRATIRLCSLSDETETLPNVDLEFGDLVVTVDGGVN